MVQITLTKGCWLDIYVKSKSWFDFSKFCISQGSKKPPAEISTFIFQNELLLQSDVWVEKKEGEKTFYYNVITNNTTWDKPKENSSIKVMLQADFDKISVEFFSKHQKSITENALKQNMIESQRAYENFKSNSGNPGPSNHSRSKNSRKSDKNNRGFR